MISIISSLYKSDRYLSQLQKAFAEFAKGLQEASVDFELIVIANDPTEADKQFAENFANRPWFKFISIGREPLYATWNRGVSLAKGEIAGFWNVDDVRYSQALIEAMSLIVKGAELVYFPFLIKRYLKIGRWYLPLSSQKIDKQIPEFSLATKRQFLEGMVCGPFFVFTKTLYDRVGPFDEQFKIAGDFDWCARAARTSDRLVKAKSLAGEFRVDGGGLSAGGSPRQIAENNIIYMRNGAWEKMSLAEDLVIKQYRPKFLSFKGEFKNVF